jgi:hypothetical protein
MQEQADFWLISRVLVAFSERQKLVLDIKKRVMEEERGKIHHNTRHEPCKKGGVFCDTAGCGQRDIDKCFTAVGVMKKVASDYAPCKKCKKMVKYSTSLGWCHKCRMCRSCQAGVCPNDDNLNMSNMYSSSPPAVKESSETIFEKL